MLSLKYRNWHLCNGISEILLIELNQKLNIISYKYKIQYFILFFFSKILYHTISDDVAFSAI